MARCGELSSDPLDVLCGESEARGTVSLFKARLAALACGPLTLSLAPSFTLSGMVKTVCNGRVERRVPGREPGRGGPRVASSLRGVTPRLPLL